jgi:hypothetical protein
MLIMTICRGECKYLNEILLQETGLEANTQKLNI